MNSMLPTWIRPEARPLGRRIVVLVTLALLLFCGPAHVWHFFCGEGSGPPGQESHQCILCSVFAHSPFVDSGGITLAPEPVLVGAIVLLEPSAPPIVTLPRSHARAPPSLLS